MCGIQNKSYRRPIGIKIKKYFKENNLMNCIACGSKSNLEIDHKNGLYNDIRVLNIKTQLHSDFQILCKHCNNQKRHTYVIMKKTGVRYSATNIKSLNILNVKYTSGDEKYDVDNPNTMVGTYWYDPVKFIENAVLLKFGKINI